MAQQESNTSRAGLAERFFSRNPPKTWAEAEKHEPFELTMARVVRSVSLTKTLIGVAPPAQVNDTRHVR